MREVHEYLADREVIQQGAEPISYQQLLFNEVSGNPEYIIANNFNLLTKKRIIMLIKKSKKSAALRIGVLMPFILTAAFVIAMIQGNSLLAQIQPPPPPPPSQAPPPPPPPPPHPQDKEKAVSPQKKTTEKGSAVKKESQVKYVAPVVPGQAKNGKQDEPVFTVVENPPKYPGGDDARIKYMVGSMKYPEVARTKGIQGTVYVTFIIETDGAVSNVKILRGVGGGCDEEAQRVVSEMPKWIPGTQDGKAVRVQYNLPISFRLGDGKESKQTEKK
jgi:protein TonB